MTDVFISYSRKDIAFARLLHQALNENDLETWIDWQAEVYGAIEGADAFVFVISETSLNSEICGLEIAQAVQHNKRLIPIVIKDVDAGQVPKDLAVLNECCGAAHGEVRGRIFGLPSVTQYFPIM